MSETNTPNAAPPRPAAEPESAVDTGTALQRCAVLLHAFEESGRDLGLLTSPGFPQGDWATVLARARRREQWNPRVFSGEEQMCTKLYLLESDEIRAEAHSQVLCYERRSKTSHTIASALVQQLCDEGEGTADDPAFKGRLGELLSVARALAAEHELMLELAEDARLGDAEQRNTRLQAVN